MLLEEPMSKSYPIIKPIVVMVVVNNENRTLCDPDCQFNGADGCGLFRRKSLTMATGAHNVSKHLDTA